MYCNVVIQHTYCIFLHIGMGYWLTGTHLQETILRLAGTQFRKAKNPNHCLLMYLVIFYIYYVASFIHEMFHFTQLS